ncbi:MAG: esterase-like activity of phytase family protein [Mariniblastus sp.]|nr:esterase-like activity of phytase family protein [Mariniblastus sp.]
MNTQLKFTLISTLVGLMHCFISVSEAKPAQTVATDIELIGRLEIPGTLKDQSGLREKFYNATRPTSTSNDMFGGISAITYSGKEDIFLMLADRGPDDGAVDWTCRFQKVRLKLIPGNSKKVKFELLDTILLKDENGVGLTGLASAFPSFALSESNAKGIPNVKTTKNDQAITATFVRATTSMAGQRNRLDPEGIRIAANGNIWVSDEYGPRIIEFNPGGQFIRELSPPAHFLISMPGISKADENPKNLSGRQCNRGMEGLAMSLDSKTIFGLMQSPLLQDSYRATVTDKPMGLNCRLLKMSVDGSNNSEFVYQLDDVANKLNEILRVDDDLFITIERDGLVGVEAKFKKLMLVSTKRASTISGESNLPVESLPVGVVPVKKKVLIDLLDSQWKLAGEKMPEKIEGLAFGPNLPDGRKTLFVASDNDFETAHPTAIWVFALPDSFLSLN